MEIPISIISLSLSIVLLPTISKHIMNNQTDKALEVQKKVFRFSLLLMMPSACGLFLLSDTIISVLFERGEFGILSTYNTARALELFAIGLPPQALILILLPYFFTIQKTKNILIYAIVTFLINLLIILISVEEYGFKGLAFSLSISSWIFMLFLILEYSFINQNLLNKEMIVAVAKYILISIIISFCIIIMSNFSVSLGLNKIFALITIILFSVGIYGILTYKMDYKFLSENLKYITKKVSDEDTSRIQK